MGLRVTDNRHAFPPMARPRDPLARSALIAAARREFVRSGLQKARIEDITGASGLSKGAFYLHFESKEALFRGLVDELETQFERLRSAREFAYIELMSRGMPGRGNPAPFLTELRELEGSGDLKVLELLWEWRDVADVLLRGSQGTEFETVMWTLLDRESERVESTCRVMQRAGMLRDDVPPELLGSMMVGTYLLMVRRMVKLTAKPDFEPWVNTLHLLIGEGATSPSLRAHRGTSVRRPRGLRALPSLAAPAKRRRR